MELVSVIVPVYNVEKYLPECLDSILASTYSNLEIILVDDGSPDNSPQICDEYTLKDSRIKVIHQENQGLVAARNIGLASATGTYIGFVDSDDVVSPVRQNEQSIMSLYYKKKGRIEHAIANVNCWAFIANNSHITDIDLKKHIDSRAAYLAHSTLWRIYRHGAERDYQGFVSEARNYIKEHFKDLITQKETYNAKIFAAIWLCRNLFPAWKIVAKASALFG